VAFEAAFGWSWLAGLLEDYGFEAHLVHPLRCKAIASARLKNDKVDAAILAQLLRADLLPEAWLAPPQVRQLRALLRHRASLVRLGAGQRNRIHAVAADHGYDRSASYWTGPGRGWLAELDLRAASREIVTDCLAVIDGLAPDPSSLSMIFRRLPASSSFVLAAARLRALQLGPWPRRREGPGSCEEGSRRTVSPARRQHARPPG
jgi:hypothetical protein